MPDNPTRPPVTVTLEAGPTGTGSIDDFELFYARRVLDRLRARLGRQGLLDLLAADIEKGNAFLRESALTSDGGFTAGTTVLTTRGLTSGQFLAWMEKTFANDENARLAAHPEHYAMFPGVDGTFTVVENIGPPRLLLLHGRLGNGRDGLGLERGRTAPGVGVSAQDVLEPLPGRRHRRGAGADPVR
ncbi:hypothetical protein GCM10020295_00780 [Streptomyces cinereospinus]